MFVTNKEAIVGRKVRIKEENAWNKPWKGKHRFSLLFQFYLSNKIKYYKLKTKKRKSYQTALEN